MNTSETAITTNRPYHLSVAGCIKFEPTQEPTYKTQMSQVVSQDMVPMADLC